MTYKANITQRNKHPIQREAEKLIPLPPFFFFLSLYKFRAINLVVSFLFTTFVLTKTQIHLFSLLNKRNKCLCIYRRTRIFIF